MKDLNEITVFARVAQLGSFSKAAASLQMPVSTVSRKVSQLEERLGLTLLQRTTRRLNLTAVGQQFYGECAEALQRLDEAEAAIGQQNKQPEGHLKISVPVGMSNAEFMELISSYLRRYPKVSLEFLVTNEFVDLIANQVDLAIRFGELSDTSLISLRLGTSHLSLAASPEYLKRHGTPRNPQDLTKHECIVYKATKPLSEWRLTKGKKTRSVKVTGRVTATEMSAIKALALSGHGIARLPDMYMIDNIKDGTLCRVLSDWQSPTSPVHALYPSRKFNPARLTAFLDALKTWKSPYWQ